MAADIVISATEIEVLISDSLAEGLGVIAPGSEMWKFMTNDQMQREAAIW